MSAATNVVAFDPRPPGAPSAQSGRDATGLLYD